MHQHEGGRASLESGHAPPGGRHAPAEVRACANMGAGVHHQGSPHNRRNSKPPELVLGATIPSAYTILAVATKVATMIATKVATKVATMLAGS